MKALSCDEPGSWEKAVTCADGVWLTKGYHSTSGSATVRNYRKRVTSSSCWGTYEDIFIFATLLQSPILVYCSNTVKWVHCLHMMCVQCVLHLINHDDLHYDAVNAQIDL